MKLKLLSILQVLFIHNRIIKSTGGSQGIRDIGLLESALSRMHATYEGRELYPDIFSKAAALMESVCGNHAFVDGNKRVSITAAAIFLKLNGWKLTVSQKELERFTLAVASGNKSLEEIQFWLKKNSKATAK
jgi:death-on-curing protein